MQFCNNGNDINNINDHSHNANTTTTTTTTTAATTTTTTNNIVIIIVMTITPLHPAAGQRGTCLRDLAALLPAI